LYLGAVLNNELVSLNLVFGALLVMTGLAIYQWAGKLTLPVKDSVDSI